MKKILVAIIFTLSITVLAFGQNLSKQAKAVEAIEKLGGKVEFENNQVVKVDLNKTKITDADLKNLEVFTELRWLDVRITAIGDEGAAHLKGLKKLTFLNLFRTN